MTSFAFVFPGQGSQAVGMLDAWGDHPAVRQTLQEASAALGEDIAGLIAHGPKEQLDLTTHTQPVMLTAAIACWRAWLSEGGAMPVAVAGHSLGEYSALVAAQALSLADAQRYRMIVATALDGVPLGLGGLGPLWAVYDADRLPAFKAKPLKERFALCPWGLYFIDVKSA